MVDLGAAVKANDEVVWVWEIPNEFPNGPAIVFRHVFIHNGLVLFHDVYIFLLNPKARPRVLRVHPVFSSFGP